MSGHSQRNLALLKQAEQEDIDVDDDAIRNHTSTALRKHADDLDDLRRDAHPSVDTALADTSHTLRQIADALDAGITHPGHLRTYLDEHAYNSVADAVDAFEDQAGDDE